MTTPLRLRGFIEGFQDHISANYSDDEGRTYTTAENFIVGESLDIEDVEELLGSVIDLSIYDQAEQLQLSSRRTRAVRGVRFVFKDDFGQAALNRAHAMVEWLSGLNRIEMPLFSAMLVRFSRLPGIVAGRPSGAYLSDFVVHYTVLNKT